MKSYLEKIDEVANGIVNKYPFIREEDISYVSICREFGKDDLFISFKDGLEIIFDPYLYYQATTYHMLKENEIDHVTKIGRYELLVVFKNGMRMRCEMFHNHVRGCFPEDHIFTDEELKMLFRNNLQLRMDYACLKQEDLAELLGTSQTMISRYISGKCIPSGATLFKLTKILHCTVDDLFS